MDLIEFIDFIQFFWSKKRRSSDGRHHSRFSPCPSLLPLCMSWHLELCNCERREVAWGTSCQRRSGRNPCSTCMYFPPAALSRGKSQPLLTSWFSTLWRSTSIWNPALVVIFCTYFRLLRFMNQICSLGRAMTTPKTHNDRSFCLTYRTKVVMLRTTRHAWAVGRRPAVEPASSAIRGLKFKHRLDSNLPNSGSSPRFFLVLTREHYH